MNSPFVVNGKAYNSLDEMPPDVRARFESVSNLMSDRNQNGIPDIVDNLMPPAHATVVQTNAVIFEGKTYNSPDELPPEGRAAYEKAMAKLADANQDGVPDVIADALKSAPTIVTSQVSVSEPRVAKLQDNAKARPLAPPATTSNMGPIIVLSIVGIGLALIILLALVLVLTKAGH